MRADSVGAPVTPQQWNYIHDMGGALRQSLDNVTAVFAPSCIGHSVLTKKDWLRIKIDDISLAEALRCWEQASVTDKLKIGNGKRKNKNGKHRRNWANLTPEQRAQRRKERRAKQQRNSLKNFLQANTTTTDIPRSDENGIRLEGENDLINLNNNNRQILPNLNENEPMNNSNNNNNSNNREPENINSQFHVDWFAVHAAQQNSIPFSHPFIQPTPFGLHICCCRSYSGRIHVDTYIADKS